MLLLLLLLFVMSYICNTGLGILHEGVERSVDFFFKKPKYRDSDFSERFPPPNITEVSIFVEPYVDAVSWGWVLEDPIKNNIPLRNCSEKCLFTSNASNADVIVREVFSHYNGPPLSRYPIQFGVMWEADLESGLRNPLLMNVTMLSWRVSPSSRVVPCGYLYSAKDLLAQARHAVKYFPYANRSHALGYISRNSRPFRDNIVKRLGNFISLFSYGAVMKTHVWPDERVGDKQYAFNRVRFCIAIENTMEAEYLTEKLWDAFRAGCIPIFKGRIGNAVIPNNSIIDIDSFKSLDDLGNYLQNISDIDAMKYLQWTQTEPKEFLEFWENRSLSHVLCRVCQNAYGRLVQRT